MKINRYLDVETQAKALAESVAKDISSVLQSKPKVVVSVPGGQTPKLFYSALFRLNLPWNRIVLVLNDERWVKFENAQSNERMLYERLVESDAILSQRVSFYHSKRDIDSQVNVLTTQMQRLDYIDICVLGMGEDGHIASLFSNMPNIARAIDAKEDPALIVSRPSHLSEPRVSFNLAALLTATHHYLLITGPSKLHVLEAYQSKVKPLVPIDYLLKIVDLQVYYSS